MGLPRTLMDNASKMPHGVVIALMNAGFKNSEAWQWRENARQSGRWHFTQRCEPAPWITAEELEDVRRRNPATRVNRLFFGIWGEEHGEGLSQLDVARAICLKGPVFNKPANIYAVAVCIDLALTRHSAAVTAVGWDIYRKKLQLLDSTLFRPGDFPDGEIKVERVKQEAIEFRKRFDAVACGADAWQCVSMLQDFTAQGTFQTVMRVNFTSQNKTKQAHALLECLRDGLLEIYQGHLAQDLRESSVIERASGIAILSPENDRGHADTLASVLSCLPELVSDLHILAATAKAQGLMQVGAYDADGLRGIPADCGVGSQWSETDYPASGPVVMRRPSDRTEI
jgi:hypothetical protein